MNENGPQEGVLLEGWSWRRKCVTGDGLWGLRCSSRAQRRCVSLRPADQDVELSTLLQHHDACGPPRSHHDGHGLNLNCEAAPAKCSLFMRAAVVMVSPHSNRTVTKAITM